MANDEVTAWTYTLTNDDELYLHTALCIAEQKINDDLNAEDLHDGDVAPLENFLRAVRHLITVSACSEEVKFKLERKLS